MVILFVLFMLMALPVAWHATAVPVDVYQVRIEGVTYNETPFTRTGLFYLSPSLDFLIVSGNPPVAPQAGAIWFMSSRAFGVLLDDKSPTPDVQFTSVQADGQGTVTYVVNDRLASSETSALNVVNAHTGLLKQVYYIAGGTMQVTFSNDGVNQNLNGRIDIRARGFLHPYSMTYVASISGVMVNTIEL